MTDAAWRARRAAAHRILNVLEPLEPTARRRVLGAAAILLGYTGLARALVDSLPDVPEPPGGES